MPNKKIVFVAHEFGFYPGHGGIASYLYQLVSAILERKKELEVDVLALEYDRSCDLLQNKRFHLHPIQPGSLRQQGLSVLRTLKKLQPDYVELAEFLALGLESLLYRALYGQELSHTVFITDHHTASRECFEWSTQLPVRLAPYPVQEAFRREQLQMLLCDLNESPSVFLSRYVQKNYRLAQVQTMRHPVNLEIRPRAAALQRVMQRVSLEGYQGRFILSCITRVEGRKNQRGLVQAFVQFCERTKADALLLLVGNSAINNVTGQQEKLELFREISPAYQKRIQFFDFMDAKGKEMILSLSDVAVLASPFENFPVAMTECVYQEVPVIASRYSGCYDFMEGCAQITAFDPFEPESLTEAICRFWQLSKQERVQLAKTQLENLRSLTGPENSVEHKLNTYAALRPRLACGPLQSAPVYVTQSNFFDPLAAHLQGKCCNLVLVPNKSAGRRLPERFRQNGGLFAQAMQQSVIAIGDENFDYDMMGALISRKVLLLDAVEIPAASQQKRLYQLVAEQLWVRAEQFYYFPVLHTSWLEQKQRTDEPEPPDEEQQVEIDCYQILLNELFYRKNRLDLEGCL